MANILKQIIKDKKLHVKALKKKYEIEEKLNKSNRNFKENLEKNAGFILECKKASPSKGLIRKDFSLDELAKVYEKYATCISVLSDEKYFQGSFENVRFMSKNTTKPILCKDFFISSFQVRLARQMGADAILLMLSVLNNKRYKKLSQLAKSLNMSILTEVSNKKELKRALKLDAEIIGINNRDLRTLKTDIKNTIKLSKKIPKNKLVISESGIYTNEDVLKLKKYANAFLVGSSLMEQKDLQKACKTLIYGENKVCGLTSVKDAKKVKNAGAIYGGLIFYKKSPRFVSDEIAQEISKIKGLDFVGVFVDESIENIVKKAKTLDLKAVQVYNNNESFLKKLKEKLPKTCEIWQVFSVKDKLENKSTYANKILYDTACSSFGGSGQSFDWTLLKNAKKPFIIAGGLNINNVKEAKKTGAFLLDFNSGVEKSAGKKSKKKLKKLFKKIKSLRG